MESVKFLIWLLILGGLAFFGLALSYVEYSSYGAVILKSAIGLILFTLVDRYIFNGFNTVHEIKENNIAYAVFLLAVAVIIAGGLMGA